MTKSTRNFSETQKLAATDIRAFRRFLLMAQFEAAEIGARIKQARKERGMTQDELAAISSFSARSLQDYEAGTTIPYKHLKELARLLRKDEEWFLYGDDEPAPSSGDTDTASLEDTLRRLDAQDAQLARIEKTLEDALEYIRQMLGDPTGGGEPPASRVVYQPELRARRTARP